MEHKNGIGARLGRLRGDKSQSDVANELGIEQRTLSYWENEERRVKDTDVIKLADYYKTTCDYILRGIDSGNVDIYEVTGLSQEAIENLKRIKRERSYLLPLISEIIENEKGESRTKKKNGIDLIERLLLYYMERKNEAYQVQFRAGINMIGRTKIGNIIAEHFLNDILRAIENYNPECVVPDIQSGNMDVIKLPDDEDRYSTPLEANQFFGIGYGTRDKDGQH